MRGRRPIAVAAVACAAALIVGACEGDDTEPTPEADANDTTRVEPNPVCIGGQDAPKRVNPARPAVAVKIENSPAARPQSGLEKADLVFEERVEGGITRFLVIYHCGEATHAGPVRSGRFDDPKLAKPFTTLLAASGSNLIVEREMKRRGMDVVDEDSAGDALFRDPPGSTDVHSLFANTERLRRIAKRKKVPTPPAKAFAYGPLRGRAKRANRVMIGFSESGTIEYRWKGGVWKRFEAGSPFMTAAGKQIGVPNLVIQEVRVDNSDRIVDSVGFPSPDISLQKEKGRALLFRDHRVIRGKWRMGKVGALPVFTTRSGKPLLFATGPIWIELVPSKAGEVKGHFSFK